jgi:hypothetical protein
MPGPKSDTALTGTMRSNCGYQSGYQRRTGVAPVSIFKKWIHI